MTKSESLEGNYKFVADPSELAWFFENVLRDLSKESIRKSYLMCIATRPKKLNKEERETFGISGSDGVMMREEIISPRGKDRIWSFEEFLTHIYKYECPKRGMITKNGYAYPDKSLAVMIYAEPSDEVKVANELVKYAHEIISQTVEACERTINFGNNDGIKGQLEKMAGIAKKSKSIYAQSTEKVFIHYDFDLNETYKEKENREFAEKILRDLHEKAFGKGNYFIIKTNGGYHTLVKRTCLGDAAAFFKKLGKNDPVHGFADYVDANLDYALTVGEKRVQDQCFVPVPGTWMYGSFIPIIINKDDFNAEEKD